MKASKRVGMMLKMKVNQGSRQVGRMYATKKTTKQAGELPERLLQKGTNQASKLHDCFGQRKQERKQAKCMLEKNQECKVGTSLLAFFLYWLEAIFLFVCEHC